jgi:hypothetical protein
VSMDHFVISFFRGLISLFILFQLKYHDSGREKTCVPSVGQWNMINKVNAML